MKTPILVKAADKLLAGGKFKGLLNEMKQFAKENPWCEESALFYSLTHHNEETKDKIWWSWEGPLRWVLLALSWEVHFCSVTTAFTLLLCWRRALKAGLKCCLAELCTSCLQGNYFLGSSPTMQAMASFAGSLLPG